MIKILNSKHVLLIQLVTQILSTVVPFPTNLNDFTQVKLCYRINQHIDWSHWFRWLTKIVIDLQNLTLIGALLYYIGLKHTIDNLDEGEKNKEKETETEEDDKASTSKGIAKANWKCQLHKLHCFISVVPIMSFPILFL